MFKKQMFYHDNVNIENIRIESFKRTKFQSNRSEIVNKERRRNNKVSRENLLLWKMIKNIDIVAGKEITIEADDFIKIFYEASNHNLKEVFPKISLIFEYSDFAIFSKLLIKKEIDSLKEKLLKKEEEIISLLKENEKSADRSIKVFDETLDLMNEWSEEKKDLCKEIVFK